MVKTYKLLSKLLLIFVILTLSIATAGEAYALWFNPDWSFRQMITINSSQVPGGLTNFPVLVSVTDLNLRQMPNGNVGKTNGGDIVFTLSDGFAQLNHEIESYNPSTGQIIAWVQVPNVSSAADTILYMYYGNAGAADQWETDGSTWDSNFIMVQHLHETAGTHFDSTSNANDGSPMNGVTQNTTGQINGADDFDGSNDYVSTPSIDLANRSFTVEAWIKPDTSPPLQQCWFEAHKSFALQQSIHLRTYSTGRIRFGYYWDDLDTLAGVVQFGEWNHIVVSYDNNTDESRIYYNGVLNISGNPGPFIGASPVIISIGKCYTQYLNGTVDEVRISNITRSPDWIETSYNNQNDSSLFLSFEPQEEFVPVPTMTQWGMIVFIMLAGFGAVYYLRRRRYNE